jgi:hypothetical protein
MASPLYFVLRRNLPDSVAGQAAYKVTAVFGRNAGFSDNRFITCFETTVIIDKHGVFQGPDYPYFLIPFPAADVADFF